MEPVSPQIEETGVSKRILAAAFGRYAFRIRLIGVAILVLCFVSYLSWFRAPAAFPEGTLIEVPSGSSLSSVSELFGMHGLIRSPFWFKVLVTLEGGSRRIVAGEYYFPSRQSAFSIANRIGSGAFGLVQTKVTVPEGLGAREIAGLLSKTLPNFDADRFLAAALPKEGYLFPDTYFFLPNASSTEIAARMTANFDAHIGAAAAAIEASGHTLPDIVNVASLLEKEAKSDEDRRIVAGILWKRLSLGMPLQADASVTYVNGGRAPSAKDLTIDSPYNTYLHTGLPPTPIGNPGIEAILAAANPLQTEFLYYLSDKDGVLHYATTYEEHQANERKYLR